MKNAELYTASEDVLYLMNNAKSIGWISIKEQTIQRVLYLAKVLYSFTHNDNNIFDYYHYSTSLYGPYSSLIENSITFLESNEFLRRDVDGNLLTYRESPVKNIDEKKQVWLKQIILILGAYGEDKVFNFTINDPLYKEAVEINSQKNLDTNGTENKTIQVLNKFKEAFEVTIVDTSKITKGEYLNLYFEYIFSQILKG